MVPPIVSRHSELRYRNLTLAPSNAYFTVMRAQLISWVCVLFLSTGCTTLYVGPRMGFEMPVAGGSNDPLITDQSSASAGVTGGVWLGAQLTDRWSIETAPGVLTQQRRNVYSGVYADNATSVDLTAYQAMSMSSAQIPLNIRYAFAPWSSDLTLYALGGVGYEYVRARRYELNGVARIADVEWPFYDENTQALATQRSTVSITAGTGLQYKLSTTWRVRGELSVITRTSSITSGAGRVLVGYDAFDEAMFYDFSSAYPRAALALHIGIVGYF